MKKQNIVVIANQIRSVLNVGSIFRTCDAIGATKLYLIGRMATPQNQPRVAKTALGAEKTVSWEYSYQLAPVIKRLKIEGYEIIGLELKKGKSIPYTRLTPKKKCAIILGNEVTGLSNKTMSLCDKVVHLPMLGKKGSLNVSVAFGAIAYYILSKHKH